MLRIRIRTRIRTRTPHPHPLAPGMYRGGGGRPAGACLARLPVPRPAALAAGRGRAADCRAGGRRVPWPQAA